MYKFKSVLGAIGVGLEISGGAAMKMWPAYMWIAWSLFILGFIPILWVAYCGFRSFRINYEFCYPIKNRGKNKQKNTVTQLGESLLEVVKQRTHSKDTFRLINLPDELQGVRPILKKLPGEIEEKLLNQTSIRVAQISENYKGKWTALEGFISDIDIDDNNVTITFRTRCQSSIFAVFHLAFKDELTHLENGDSLGFCGQIGRLDRLSIWYINCTPIV